MKGLADLKVLLPLIRKTMPTLVAQSIVGVQPMGPMGSPVSTTKVSVVIDEVRQGVWRLSVSSWSKTPDVHKWLEENIPCGSYFCNATLNISMVEFSLYSAEDVDAFKLTWAGRAL